MTTSVIADEPICILNTTDNNQKCLKSQSPEREDNDDSLKKRMNEGIHQEIETYKRRLNEKGIIELSTVTDIIYILIHSCIIIEDELKCAKAEIEKFESQSSERKDNEGI